MTTDGGRGTGTAGARTVIVTGGAQGLGLAIARAFLEEGPIRVVLADVNEEILAAAGARLRADFAEDRVLAAPVNVTDETSVTQLIEKAADWGKGIDVLVNCAGVISRGPSDALSWSSWERDLDVNVGGSFRCSRAAYPHLRASPAASIVNIGSLGSFLGMPMRSSYNTSKAAVLGLTRTLAAEWGRAGIRVNAICPGFVDTEMMRSGMTSGLLSEARIMDRLPLQRLGRPEEIASVAVFLASEGASYVNGAVLPVDGGLLIDGTFF